MSTAVTRTTLALPSDLLARVDRAVRKGQARSRNALVAAAVERVLAQQERAAIDAAFAGMSQDKEYLKESERIDAEFAAAVRCQSRGWAGVGVSSVPRPCAE